MENSVLQRVKELIALKSKSVRQFSQQIGVEQNTLNQYVQGRRKLSLEAILSILVSFDDISAEWLLRGKGTMTGENFTTEPPIMNNSQIMSLVENVKLMSEKASYLYDENMKLKEEIESLKGLKTKMA